MRSVVATRAIDAIACSGMPGSVDVVRVNRMPLGASGALTAFAARLRGPELDEAALTYRPHVNLRVPDRLRVTFKR